MLNMCRISSLMTAIEGPVAEFSSFANFEEKKRKSKTGNQMGSFGQIRKKFVFPLLSADSRYFRISALNNLDRSVITGKSQISAYRIDLAIARSIRQALSLRFYRNDFTPGH